MKLPSRMLDLSVPLDLSIPHELDQFRQIAAHWSRAAVKADRREEHREDVEFHSMGHANVAISAFVPETAPCPGLNLIQPSPKAETPRPLFPSWRVCISGLHQWCIQERAQ